ncbi:hypothetical protein WICMUC_004781 [Wickerhamomyces mucosus]|uniref:Initiation-specific alpha-1,6-mannosyltransferase n=1 Tax=Wickerhamomyces mucosus TaxID=1378264 RepID=A0A9P8PGG2_9ASCO|nr:hypothetical protein WICMUC_004781 [Wickerhamomyces mucosus]
MFFKKGFGFVLDSPVTSPSSTKFNLHRGNGINLQPNWNFTKPTLSKLISKRILIILIISVIVISSIINFLNNSNINNISIDNPIEIINELPNSISSVKDQMNNLLPKTSPSNSNNLGDDKERLKDIDDLFVDTDNPTSTEDKSRLFKDYVENYHPEDLRSRLASSFPYDRNSIIPKKIWQTWKDNSDKINDDKILKNIKSWKSQQNYEYNLLDDKSIESLIIDTYIDFPEILKTYEKLPLNILRFDLSRYLILYAFGGLYTDIDTFRIRDINYWADVPEFLKKYKLSLENSQENEIGLLLGIEGDIDKVDWKFRISRRVQLCQWTLKAKKGHPVLREVIYRIVDLTLNEYNPKLNHVKINKEYFTLHSIYTILEWTGPALFTDVTFKHLNKLNSEVENLVILNDNENPQIKHLTFDSFHQDRNSVDITKDLMIGWQNFTKMDKPIRIDDVLILPINSFNGIDNPEISYETDIELNYVKHEFQGTWKSLV